PSPRGVPQVEVTFDIDANGILNVKAADKATGKEQSITITASSGLSKEEVEKMKKEAELHADEDKKKKALIDLRNNADAVIYQTEKLLQESGSKVSEEIKKEVTEKMEALKKVKDGEDVAAINNALAAMNQTVQKIGQAMYAASAPGANGQAVGEQSSSTEAGSANDSSAGKTGPVEAEYEEVKDENSQEPKSAEPKEDK
ncbi:MAG: Chaperone protein DnaK, partial [Parcubacteria group bacterium GW2011_GWA2_43_17]